MCLYSLITWFYYVENFIESINKSTVIIESNKVEIYKANILKIDHLYFSNNY